MDTHAHLDGLLPVTFFFPSKSRRWVADACRAGKIPARKVGGEWLITRAAFERFASGGDSPKASSLDAVVGRLRAGGHR